MIQTEYLKDGTLTRHYSDSGMVLLQVETGIKYSEAIDVVPCAYTYEETDEPIETQEEATEKDYIEALGELGVSFDA